MGKRNIAEMTGRGYPLVEDRVQAGMMLHVRKVERPVSRSKMAEVLGVSRSKVSMEVGRLIELGLLEAAPIGHGLRRGRPSQR